MSKKLLDAIRKSDHSTIGQLWTIPKLDLSLLYISQPYYPLKYFLEIDLYFKPMKVENLDSKTLVCDIEPLHKN